jgi:hypothetical protein
MSDYINKILTAFDKAESKGVGTKTSAAPDCLFKVDKSCVKLAQNKDIEFQNLVAKTLYATKRARPNMLIPQVRPAHKYPISPWEMIHLPLGDNALCAPPYTIYTAVCNKSLTATYQYKISNPSNKAIVNNNY